MTTGSHAGLLTLDLALAAARDGRPLPLLYLVRDAMGEDVYSILLDLLQHPDKIRRRRGPAVLPYEAEAIRALYAAQGLNKRGTPAIKREAFARSLGLEFETLRDIIEQKHAYSERGEQRVKRSPRSPPK